MRRRIKTSLLFLLLGAIVNVTVAWGIVTVRAMSRGPGFMHFDPQAQWPRRVPDDWPDYAYYCWRRSFGFNHDSFWSGWSITRADEDFEGGTFYIDIAYVGWPMRSLRWELWHRTQYVPDVSSTPMRSTATIYRLNAQPEPAWLTGGIPLPSDSGATFGPPSRHRLPLRPLWAGFIINTIIYATVLWTVWAVRRPLCALPRVRRLLRMSGGRCPQCGYDLRGRLEAGCSECGWNRPRQGGSAAEVDTV